MRAVNNVYYLSQDLFYEETYWSFEERIAAANLLRKVSAKADGVTQKDSLPSPLKNRLMYLAKVNRERADDINKKASETKQMHKQWKKSLLVG